MRKFEKIDILIDTICAVLIAGWGVYTVTQGRIIDRGYLILNVAFPLVLILSVVLINKCIKPIFFKAVISILWYVPLTIFIFLILLLGGADYLTKYNENDLIQTPQMIREDGDFIPNLDQIGDTQQVEYYHFYRDMRLFESDAYVLVCEYGSDEYENQKAIIEQKCVFEDKIDERNDAYIQYVCYPYAEIDGFLFRRLADKEDDDTYESYPKEVHIVATNDDTHEILYIDYYDFDLDYISSFDSFIMEDCGWKYISNRRYKSFDFSNIVEFIKVKASEL